MFHEIVVKLINPDYVLSKGGEPIRLVRTALQNLEKKFGALSSQRIVDYVVCSLYPFKDRGSQWKINQVFGPNSIQQYNSDKIKTYYQDRWLQSAELSRTKLLSIIVKRSEHPKAKFVFIPNEEGTKMRLLNRDVGFAICQASTLGWSPMSEACNLCNFVKRCQKETQNKYPEIYRLRIEYGSK